MSCMVGELVDCCDFRLESLGIKDYGIRYGILSDLVFTFTFSIHRRYRRYRRYCKV